MPCKSLLLSGVFRLVHVLYSISSYTLSLADSYIIDDYAASNLPSIDYIHMPQQRKNIRAYMNGKDVYRHSQQTLRQADQVDSSEA
mmetsp:Transcript_62626/g.75367  ORF Transcript_62626/g.75367 Transcript_62626/m.75367 type:complete len:86 (+) Transcript_62626:253-510(+)